MRNNSKGAGGRKLVLRAVKKCYPGYSGNPREAHR